MVSRHPLPGALAACMAAAAVLGPAPAADAAPACPGTRPAPRDLVSGRGTLESVILDARGRLFFTDVTAKSLLRLDRPGAQPVPLVTDLPDAPGGLAVEPAGTIVMGVGDSIATGAIGNLAPRAELWRVDPDSGRHTVYARGLQMTNGVERGRDGTIYASSDVGLGIDRVAPGGQVELRWATAVSPNGMAIESTGRYLFAAQTFQPAAVLRVDTQDPSRVDTYARAAIADIAAGLDGMAIDGDDRLLVAANQGGGLWRVAKDRSICSLTDAIPQASDVALGVRGSAFAADSAFVTSFGGRLVEVPQAGSPLPASATQPATPNAIRRPRVLFTPRAVRVRRGRAAFVPRVRVDGAPAPVVLRLRVPGGGMRHLLSGRRVSLALPQRARGLRVTFVVARARYRSAIRLRR